MLATLRQRDFALLWIAGLISIAGNYALIVALPLHAYALTGSAIATGGVFAATVLPRILLGSVAGVFVDRWDRKWTMVAADLLRAAVMLPLLAVVSSDLLWLLYLVRAVTGMLGLLFEPAEAALLPRLVGEERLVTANALNALNNNLGRLIGPAIGGVLYAAGGMPAVVVVDAASFAASGVLIMAIRTRAQPERADLPSAGASAWGRALGEWRAGLQFVAGDRSLQTLFVAFGVGFVGEGTFALAFTPLAVDVLQGGAEGAGILVSAQAVGGLLAGVLVSRAAARFAPRALFGWGLIGLGFADLGLANAASIVPPGPPAVALAAVCMALAGPPIVIAVAAGRGLLQTLTVDAFRGRVFGALGSAEGVTMLLGLVLGSAVVGQTGVVFVLSLGAAMWIAGGLFALVRLPSDVGVDHSGDGATPAR
ncbi:MAG: MFS transporter [Chloroflexota bacterium]|nr:MFS transporter [Chloroflexota bacterium]